jgi:hypothetical protein
MNFLYILSIIFSLTFELSAASPGENIDIKVDAKTEIITPKLSVDSTKWVIAFKNIAFAAAGLCLLPEFFDRFNDATFKLAIVEIGCQKLIAHREIPRAVFSYLGLGLCALEIAMKRKNCSFFNRTSIKNVMISLPALNYLLLKGLMYLCDTGAITGSDAQNFFVYSLMLSGTAFLGGAVWSIRDWRQGPQLSHGG